MSGKTGLSGEDDVLAKLATAGDAHLRDDQGAFADFDVVRDLDEVVNFRAFADDDISDLRHFAVNVAVLHVTEAVRTNHRAGVNADALADFRAWINGDVWKQVHLLAEPGVVPDEVAALQDRPRADFHAFADDTMRPDVRAGVNLCARRNDRRGMNAGGIGSFGKEQRHGLGESDAGVGHADQNFPGGFKAVVGDDGGRRALFGADEIVLIFGEREVARLGAVGGSKAFERCCGIANHFTFKVFCNFSSGKGHVWHFVRVAVDLVIAAHYKGRRIQFNLYFAWQRLCASD